jgi:hypothetical protein
MKGKRLAATLPVVACCVLGLPGVLIDADGVAIDLSLSWQARGMIRLEFAGLGCGMAIAVAAFGYLVLIVIPRATPSLAWAFVCLALATIYIPLFLLLSTLNGS